jgi:molybdenum cofactor sulfurtransferase
MAYTCKRINTFFTEALGVPCTLVRFPPGGQGLTSRSSKARKQKHQQGDVSRLAQASSDIPSPPDSDVESFGEKRILLSNESPILMINSTSVEALNHQISSRGGQGVSEATFRGNIVIEGSSTNTDSCLPYAEDFWDSVDIGEHHFKLLGACQRCHMVCIDQETAEKKQEPFVTLAKTRRLDGKVYFGVHMRHEPSESDPGQGFQAPTIQVGQDVRIHSMP